MNKNKHPSEYHPDLSEDRLNCVAQIMLDIIEDSKDKAKEIGYVDSWGVGCLCFSRLKNKLVEVIKSKKYMWLTLTKGGMDYVFNIGSVSCRYFRDDLESPAKKNFFTDGITGSLFPIDIEDVVTYRFTYQDSGLEDVEGSVHFTGYNVNQELIFTWKYDEYNTNNHVYVIENTLEEPKKLSPAMVDVKGENADNPAPEIKEQHE